jgi:hypothetical protein
MAGKYGWEIWLENMVGKYGFGRLTVEHSTILRSAHTLYLCGSVNKQRLFPYTTLTDWFL